ncbi:MAG: hypothetical protein Q8N63_05780 [Nanoarchaeota archaeon]|nr:hypothetical protein [Nanoarchaeota archaeon]
MKLESIKSLAIIGALGALALAEGCSNVFKTPKQLVSVYSAPENTKAYDEKERKNIKQRLDYQDYQDMVKESICLPSWRKVPF